MAGIQNLQYFNKKTINIKWLISNNFQFLNLIVIVLLSLFWFNKDNDAYFLMENQNIIYRIIIFSNIIPVFLKEKILIEFPNGPHIKPKWLNSPIRVYENLNYDKNMISSDNKNRSIIYQWTNLITGEIYIGSAWTGSSRLLNYWSPSYLSRKYPVYQNIKFYGKHNFSLAILEDLGLSGFVTREFLLYREQHYLNILFSKFSDLALNLAKTAGSTKGYIQNYKFESYKSNNLNPMFGRVKFEETLKMQTYDNSGINCPSLGKTKSSSTIAKLTKLVYVYNSLDMSFIEEFSTVNCLKHFKMGINTLTKYIKNGQSYKGHLFSRKKLY